jgi:TPR repeat protein
MQNPGSTLLILAAALVVIAGCSSRTTSGDDAYEKLVEHNIEVASAYRDANCEAVFRLLKLDEFPDYYPLHRAYMMIEGKCLPRDPKQAAKILRRYAGPDSHDPVALARFGDLLLKGSGVGRDPTAARALFRRAALVMLDELTRLDPEFTPKDANREARVWGLTPRGMVLGFVNPITGPWEVPGALREEADAIMAIGEAGGEALMQLAVWLREGTDGYVSDHEMAAIWLARAAGFHDYLPAKKLYAKWVYDPSFCNREGTFCPDDRLVANSYLKDLAAAGDGWASKAIAMCLERVPDYPEKKLADYFWLLERRRRGWSFDAAALEVARAALSVKDQEVIEDWNLKAHGVPFTLLENSECPLD